jgi:hypothetical protein
MRQQDPHGCAPSPQCSRRLTVPARKRRRQQQPESSDPLVRFGRALEATKKREHEEQLRVQAEREEHKRLAQLAAEQAARLATARKRLERAIASVKQARTAGSSTTEADQTYRSAKADVIELESGERPAWGPSETPDEEPAQVVSDIESD